MGLRRKDERRYARMGAKRERTRMLEGRSGRQALVAAPTISTVSNPSTTGVSSQENVLVLFASGEGSFWRERWRRRARERIPGRRETEAGHSAAPTISTITNHSMTGVSGQEKVLVLFSTPNWNGPRLVARLDPRVHQNVRRLRLLQRVDRVVADVRRIRARARSSKPGPSGRARS